MKEKTKFRSVVALLLAFVLVFVGIDPMGWITGTMDEVQAEDLTSITWTDFGFTLGTTYTGATDESSAASNAGSYASATNLNNTEFVGDVVFGDNSEIRYGGSAYNYGLKLKVEDGAFKVGGSNLYLYSTTDGSQISEIVIPKTDAGNYGLTSFADEQFTLKIKITGWNGASDWSSMYAGIWINDVAVIESVKLGSGAFGNMFCTCVYGSVTPSVKLTEITWEDFGFTLGTTYTGATDESSAASNAGSYASATNLNNTEFVGDVVFGDNSEIRYGGSAYNYGLKIKVEDGAFKVSGSNLYLYSTATETLGSQISEIVIPKTDAGNYGLTSFADEQFTLKIKITGWNGNSGWSTMYAGIWINDVAVIESVKLGSGAFGNMFCTCVYGSVTPSVKLTEITWTDFGFTLGTTYSSETEEGSGDRSGVYAGATNLNNTEFEGDIIFADNSEIRYGGSPYNCGLKLKVEDGAFKVGGSNLYLYSTATETLGSQISEIVIPKTDAGNYGLTSFADEQFTLKIKITGWNGNSGWSTMYAGIWINDVAVVESVKLGSSNFGSNFCACTYGTITLAQPKVDLTEISWEDFDGAEYGKTYSTQQLLTYKGDSLNNTAFEDDIIFPAGSTLLYGVNNAWHGLEIGVNESGQFWIHGSVYFNGGNPLDVTYEASQFGLTTLVNTRLTLRIEMRNVTDTYADVDVYVNGIQAGSRIALTKSDNSAVANIGTKIAACPFNAGDRQPFTIPEPALTEISWEDFDGAEYGKTYSSQQLLAYTGDSLNNTAFEDDIMFPAGGSLLYGVSNAWHGLEIGVNESGQFWIHGSVYFNGGNPLDVTYEASDFELTTLVNTRLTLRIEMRNVTDTYADVDVYVNGIQAGSRIALTKSDNSAVANIGTKIAACPFNSGDRQPFTIPSAIVEIPTDLTPLSWEEFGYTGSVITTQAMKRAASHLTDLNVTLFNGDVIMQSGTTLRYAENADTNAGGVAVVVNSDGTLTASIVNNGTAVQSYTVNAASYGMDSFVGNQFNLKIAFMSDGKIGVWVNDSIVGNTFDVSDASLTFGTTLYMVNAGIIPVSLRTTAPTNLTEIGFDDWTQAGAAKVSEDGYLRNLELQGTPHEDLFDTSLYEVVKFVDTNDSVGRHLFVYGGIPENSWLGINISINTDGKMIIHCVDIFDVATTVEQFTIDPVKAGVGETFRGEEFSWKIDTVRLGNHVLLYMSFNEQLYNNAPFVFHDFADSMSNVMKYNSHESADYVNNCYVKLGASIKELAVLYHDLTKGVYTIPEYQTVTFYQKDADGKWVEATKPTTLTKTGNYKLKFNDGVSDYTQEIACYYYQKDVSSASLVRSLKMKQTDKTTYATYGEGYETRLCDTDYDGKVDADDVNDIKSMLLGIYQADTDVMKISGFFSPTASLIEDATYATIKATGVNHIIESDIYYSDDALVRYRIYQELSYAQKYGLTVTVQDKRLKDIGESGGTATVETVQNAVVNYKDYQSFAGLFVFDEPKAKDYPNVGTWKGYTQVEDHSSVAKAIAAAGFEGWSNAFGGNSDLLDNGYNREAGCRMRYGYYQYLGNLVDSFDLQFMSVTDYPFIVDGSSTKDSDIQYYFMNLAMAKDVATKKGVDLRTFVQGAAAMETTLNNSFNEAQLKWHANIDLTFGSSALEYFPLVQPATLMTYADGSCASGLLDSDGNLTKFGEWATSVNKQVAAIDDILLNATHEGFMAVGDSSYATTIARNSIESIVMKTGGWLSSASTTLNNTFYEGTYETASVTSSNTEYGAFAGCFEITAGEYSGKHAMYIVNYSDASDNTVTVNLGDAVTSTTVYQGVEAEHTGTFNMTLAAGEAVLVVY